MRTERTTHKGTAIIKLIFDYDTALIARVKAIPDARWSRTMRCWYVPDTSQSAVALAQMGIAAPTKQAASPVNEENESVTTPDTGKQKEWLVRFSNYLKEQRYSERTIEHYTERLRIFFGFCRKDVLEITNDDVDNFNRNYILAKKLSATYQTQFVSAIKLFYEKTPRKRLDIALLERPRRGKALPKVLSKEEIAKIIACTSNLKHRAMLSLLYSCGLRRGELLDMRICDIDSKRDVINIRHAKGDKDRQVPLSPKILELLREDFKQYHPVTWLFEGEKPNTPYTGESLHRVFAAAKQRAGITGQFSLHVARHSYATHLMESGVNLRYIQELLGHRHIKTTAIYTHVSSEGIRKIKSPFDSLEL